MAVLVETTFTVVEAMTFLMVVLALITLRAVMVTILSLADKVATLFMVALAMIPISSTRETGKITLWILMAKLTSFNLAKVSNPVIYNLLERAVAVPIWLLPLALRVIA